MGVSVADGKKWACIKPVVAVGVFIASGNSGCVYSRW